MKFAFFSRLWKFGDVDEFTPEEMSNQGKNIVEAHNVLSRP